MATNYPNQIDDSASLPVLVDNVSRVNAEAVNRIRAAIVAIENELGVRPSGTAGTIRERLDNSDLILNTINDTLQDFITSPQNGRIVIQHVGANVGSGYFSTLNFIGSGVTIEDLGNNTALITNPDTDIIAVVITGAIGDTVTWGVCVQVTEIIPA